MHIGWDREAGAGRIARHDLRGWHVVPVLSGPAGDIRRGVSRDGDGA